MASEPNLPLQFASDAYAMQIGELRSGLGSAVFNFRLTTECLSSASSAQLSFPPTQD